MLQKGRSTVLTSEEYLYCVKKGIERRKIHVSRNTVEKNMNTYKSPDEISIQGVIGELAMCKLLNIDYHPFLDNTNYNNIFLDKGDLIYKKKSIDVKTVTKEVSDIYVNRNKTINPADFYALMRIETKTGDLEEWDFPIIVFFDGIIDSAHLFYEPGHLNKKTNQYEYSVNNLSSFHI